MDFSIGIIGGGIIGLSSAYFLLERGVKRLVLIERHRCGWGTSHVAAGMLAPINEIEFHETQIFEAGLYALEKYPQWLQRLGIAHALYHDGTYEVALEADDVPYLGRLYQFQKQYNIPIEWIDYPAKNTDIPLSPHVPAATFTPSDVQIDHILLLQTLKTYVERHSEATLMEQTALLRFEYKQQHFHLYLKKEEETFDIKTERLLLCTGVYEVEGVVPKMIPVKGQMAVLRYDASILPLRPVVRIRSRHLGNGYVVPKYHLGFVVVGSTSEMRGYDEEPSAGGIMDCLRRAYAVVPGIYELPLVRVGAGLRPQSPKELPIIDQIGDTPLYMANGFYRHGILLAPLAGEAVASLILEHKRHHLTQQWCY